MNTEDGRILDPIDRISEVLFGLFMVLTFTGTLSVASAGREDVRTMLIAAIGCNTAWGFVDAMMYVLRTLVERSRRATLLAAVRASTQPDQARLTIASHIGPLSAGLDPGALEGLRRWLAELPPHDAPRATLTARDLKGAFAVFLLVFASTFPVVLPFVFTADLKFAMRLSAAIAIVMMFWCGYTWGRYAGVRPWPAGLALVLLGVAIELVVIALGG
jgi:VIT1/CCC1 family predicted Fe2+/Mn2+ transporter